MGAAGVQQECSRSAAEPRLEARSKLVFTASNSYQKWSQRPPFAMQHCQAQRKPQPQKLTPLYTTAATEADTTL